ncbi:DUF2141 domain-containing protein [Sphingomonas sp. Leaf33]|uniref:DUF2141 domain-containing protein n=1 Tax=Sphingomonas sp. Leaf33 TaxID=1736215 RepID=UPI001F1BB79F|nr:DUF2141 domain-containing protein [Sphingomonas sp. Leaf33]
MWAVSVRLALAAAAWTLLGGASPVARLDIDIEKLRSTKGVVLLCLTSDPVNFPNCVDDARAVRRTVPATTTDIRFDALPVGTYAAAVIHDENANAKLDTMMGIPREGFGFSRNPAIGFGPPKFGAARFALDAAGTQQDIRMRYLL